MRILSWNINGLRASGKAGFLDWLYNESPDILCLQETKVDPADLQDELKNPEGYSSFFHHAVSKRGYSGVACYVKGGLPKVEFGIGEKKFDIEGRVITLHFPEFSLVNSYFPNTFRKDRLSFKMEFNDFFLEYIENLRKRGKKVIFCGDLNVASENIDLANAREQEGKAGFTEEERAWIDEVKSAGFIDTFRHFYPEKKGAYTWWDSLTRGRDRNEGWRLDYFFASSELIKKVEKAFILSDIFSSDHCPVGIELKI